MLAAAQCLLNERCLARDHRYQVMSQITGPEKKEREHEGQEKREAGKRSLWQAGGGIGSIRAGTVVRAHARGTYM